MPTMARSPWAPPLPKRVYAWGAGEDGQLGLGSRDDQHRPQPITALDGLDVSSVVAGSRNSLAICSNGDVYVWGWNQRGTLGHPPDTVSSVESTPSQVKALAGVRIVQAAIGGWHCLAVDDKQRAYAWGGNEYGQCAVKVERSGSGKVSRRDIPVPQLCVPQLRIRQVAAGGTHSVVLTEDGEVWTWGQPWPPGDIQQISVPTKVAGLEHVRTIAVGAFHNLALLESGQVWAWGNNEYGQLGTGDTQPSAQPQEIRELSHVEVVDIAAGGWHSMAITAKGEVWAWGRGEHGRMGFGDDKSSKTVPHRVDLLAHAVIVQVTCGGTHSIALSEDGRIFSFGRGDHGRLGNGLLVTNGHPREVALPAPLGPRPKWVPSATDQSEAARWQVVFAACGGQHTLILASTREPVSSCTALLPWYRARAARGPSGAADSAHGEVQESGPRRDEDKLRPDATGSIGSPAAEAGPGATTEPAGAKPRAADQRAGAESSEAEGGEEAAARPGLEGSRGEGNVETHGVEALAGPLETDEGETEGERAGPSCGGAAQKSGGASGALAEKEGLDQGHNSQLGRRAAASTGADGASSADGAPEGYSQVEGEEITAFDSGQLLRLEKERSLLRMLRKQVDGSAGRGIG